nr:GAF domain-containing protein [uncultured Flavobacterium sp.]
MTEQSRLKELYRYHILDTKPEVELDELAEIASVICNTPMSLITMVDKERTWHKSKYGFDIEEVVRQNSFCQHALNNPKEVFVVEDAQLDRKFINNPFTKGDNAIRFYAGAPLVTPRGYVLGTICVVDTQPKKITEVQKRALQILSKKAMDYLNSRKLILLQNDNIELNALKLKKLTDSAPCVIFQLKMSKKGKMKFDFLSKGINSRLPNFKSNLLKKSPKLFFDSIHPDDLCHVKQSIDDSFTNLTEWYIAYKVMVSENKTEWHLGRALPEKGKDGSVVWYGTIQNITSLIEYEKAMEQVMYDLSHVVRKPVANLLGLTSMIENEKYNEINFKEYIGYIKTVSDELDNFIKTLNQTYWQKNKKITGLNKTLPKAGKNTT